MTEHTNREALEDELFKLRKQTFNRIPEIGVSEALEEFQDGAMALFDQQLAKEKEDFARTATIMGKTFEEVVVIIHGLELEEITEIEVTMKNLNALYGKLKEDVYQANQKAINAAFAQLSTQKKGDSDGTR